MGLKLLNVWQTLQNVYELPLFVWYLFGLVSGKYS